MNLDADNDAALKCGLACPALWGRFGCESPYPAAHSNEQPVSAGACVKP